MICSPFSSTKAYHAVSLFTFLQILGSATQQHFDLIKS